MTDQFASPARVALLIACFNDGATLESAVESALAQEDVELVVIDDGSTDARTVELFGELERRGITVLHQENRGPAAARMAGVAATSAPYVTYLDADDTLPDGALAALKAALDAHPGLAVVWGDVEAFGSLTGYGQSPEEIDPWLESYVNVLPGPALFRRNELLAAGGWQLASGYEDWDLWMSLAERGSRGMRVPVLAYRYQIHGNRGWRTHSRRHGQIVTELRRRHPALFANRKQNRRRSSAPWWLKLGLPLVAGLPLPMRARQTLANMLKNPKFFFSAAVAPRLRKAGVAVGVRRRNPRSGTSRHDGNRPHA